MDWKSGSTPTTTGLPTFTPGKLEDGKSESTFWSPNGDALFDVVRSAAGVVPKSALKPLAKMAATHRAALLLEWETKLCSE